MAPRIASNRPASHVSTEPPQTKLSGHATYSPSPLYMPTAVCDLLPSCKRKKGNGVEGLKKEKEVLKKAVSFCSQAKMTQPFKLDIPRIKIMKEKPENLTNAWR